MQFAINCTHNSSIGCTPFEAGHGLQARTVSQARIFANSRAKDLDGGDDDILEDIDAEFDKSLVHNTLELATRLANEARSTSEWHRRLASNKLNQAGKPIDLSSLKIGSKVYFYKPPTALEAEKRGRKVKHLDHYAGPAILEELIGSKSFRLSYNGRSFQRDAGMIIPIKQMHVKEFSDHKTTEKSYKPTLHSDDIEPREGEFVIMKGGLDSTDWYCAQINEVLPDRLKVAWYTTQTPPLKNYSDTTVSQRKNLLKTAKFLRTWCLERGKGAAVTNPPKSVHRTRDLWTGKIPLEEWNDHALIRNVGLNSLGTLDNSTIQLASSLELPHHLGAGGEDDFVSKEAFQRHQRRLKQVNSKRAKRK